MHWTEGINVDRPVPEVRAAVADEHEPMRWSAWPEATGDTCSVDGDGRSPGSGIVFRDASGTVQGRRRLLRATDDRVEYRLRDRVPGGREMTPEVDFRVEDLGGGRSRVHLDFRATPPVPALLRRLVEPLVARRVRTLHVRDLEQLEAHVERRPAVA